MTEDEAILLSAYFDGELNATDRAQVERLLKADAATAEYYSALLTANAMLKPAYADALVAPSPDPLADRIGGRESPDSMRLLLLVRDWLRPQVLAGCAAALVAGIALGNLNVLPLRPAAGQPVLVSSGRLIAGPTLVSLLEAKQSDSTARTADFVRASFQMAAGGSCREFITGSTTGLACKHDGTWSIEIVANQPAPPPGAYTMAGDTAAEIEDAIKRLGGGQAMDRDAEIQAIGASWKH